MAIADAKKRKIGRELVEWIYLGIRTGARRGVEAYQQQKVSNPGAAMAELKRAVDLPNRARSRINEWIAQYDAQNGAGTGQTFIGECLTLFGSVTLAEINSELTTLENYANGLVSQAPTPYGDNTLTWDQIAADIESQVEWEAKDWGFPVPAGYTDVWGE